MAAQKVAMISSTILDLPDHRECVRNACLSQGVFPSMMENWPALDANSLQASIKKVNEAEIYIGIFAHRYGHIPDGFEISVTEMEYNRAVERDIPRLLFLMDGSPPGFPSKTKATLENSGTTSLRREAAHLRR
jgi:hypothetical protein